MSATKQLKPQLAAAGYKPSDVTYFVLSHYHSDHTANANDFAGINLDRAKGGAGRDVRRQTTGHHPANPLQPAEGRRRRSF